MCGDYPRPRLQGSMASTLWRAALLSHGPKQVGSSESSSMDFSSLEGAVPIGRKLPVTGGTQVAAYPREGSC